MIQEKTKVTKKKEELLKKILENKKTLVAYFASDTGTIGSSYIAEDEVGPNKWNETLNPDFEESHISNCVDILINTAIAHPKTVDAGYGTRGNKTAVECTVKGVEGSVFFCIYDSRRVICTEIREEGTKILFS
jgi:hypothetical protein